MKLAHASIPGSVLATLAVILGSYWTAGCCSCKHSQHEVPATSTAAYTIGLSSGGGFSGMHTGFVISSDGDVSYWQGMYGKKDDVIDAGKIPQDTIAILKSAIDRANLSSLGLDERGNMTTTLEITEGERRTTARWPGIDTDTDAAPAVLRPIVGDILRLLAPLRDKVLHRGSGQ